MRNLVILIGAPGAGKTSWVEKNNLEQYCLSPDNIRLLLSSPKMLADGSFGINQDNDSEVWKMLDQILEKRMSEGHFTIIDATHTRSKYLNRYKQLCELYRYRTYVKVFNPPLEELLSRNNWRKEYKKVPEGTIKLHHERLKSLRIPKSFTQIESVGETFEIVRSTKTNKRNVWVIGDIHGCYEPLNNFLNECYNEKDLYVFLGDYIDRGPNNYETLMRLINLGDNCIFLEGNHEHWLRLWSKGNINDIKSNDFLITTMPELDAKCSEQDKKDISIFLRKLRLFSCVEHKGRFIHCSHGGVASSMYDFISARQLIKGVGTYKQHLEVAESFNKNSFKMHWMCHGHRNEYSLAPISGRTINLEDKVYKCGTLVVAKFSEDVEVYKYNSDYTYNRPVRQAINPSSSIETILNSRDVQVKLFEDRGVKSVNFKRSVFKKRKWNSITCKARGLFLGIDTNDIAARSYDKFFNVGEVESTKKPLLVRDMEWPVQAIKKENGYLGILSNYNGLLFCTKSSVSGDFAKKFQGILLSQYPVESLEKNVRDSRSYIFEVIDPIFDPHIIEYSKPECVLLDIVKNTFEQKFCSEQEIDDFCQDFIRKREITTVINNGQELLAFLESAKKDLHEGYVLRDSSGFQTKLKTNYYNKWKAMRSKKDLVFKQHFIPSNEVFEADEIQFLNWCKSIGEEEVKNRSIISLRNEFLGLPLA